MLANKGAVVRFKGLVLAVDRFFHAFEQDAVLVARDQRIPVRSPDHFDHVPPGAAKIRFQLLDDLAVAAHRTVETLQVAIDDKDQVVEAFAPGKRDRAERFRLVHFTVAHERPHLAALRLDNTAVFEIFHETRLVNRHQRPQAHRHRRELPEIGHQPWVRVGRQPSAVHFLTEVVELLFSDPAFEESARINAGRGMALDVHQVAEKLIVRGAEKMVESDVVERRGGGKARDMAAEFGRFLVGAHHHRHCVPAHQRTDFSLETLVARHALFQMRKNGVEVRGVGAERNMGAVAARLVDELFEQVMRALVALDFEHRIERLQPLLRFLRIDVRNDLVHIHGYTFVGFAASVRWDALASAPATFGVGLFIGGL